MSKSINPLVIIGGGIGLYLLFGRHNTATAATVPTTGLLTTNSFNNQAALYGVNSGAKGGNGSFYTVANYDQLLAVNPNLGNPNYVMTAAENAQYLSNYSDLQQGLPLWIGHKQPDGVVPGNINQAAQEHWKYNGCAEKRIFLPLTPPSTAGYIPPPVNPAAKSSGGSSVLSTGLQIAATILPFILGSDPVLNNADIEVILTSGLIINDILPFYTNDDPIAVKLAKEKLNELLKQYS